MKIQAFDHIVLTTANLEKCLDFYAGLLGLRAKEKDGLYETADKWMERTRREVVEEMMGKKS